MFDFNLHMFTLQIVGFSQCPYTVVTDQKRTKLQYHGNSSVYK